MFIYIVEIVDAEGYHSPMALFTSLEAAEQAAEWLAHYWRRGMSVHTEPAY